MRLKQGVWKNREVIAHAVALAVALLGPLANLLLGFPFLPSVSGAYAYWAVALLIYVCILLPVTFRSPLTLLKLVPFGIAVEDFFSNMWRHLFLGGGFLPFYDWYTQYFPFLGSLGDPTPVILVPKWYLAAFALYLLIAVVQHRRRLAGLATSRKLKFL